MTIRLNSWRLNTTELLAVDHETFLGSFVWIFSFDCISFGAWEAALSFAAENNSTWKAALNYASVVGCGITGRVSAFPSKDFASWVFENQLENATSESRLSRWDLCLILESWCVWEFWQCCSNFQKKLEYCSRTQQNRFFHTCIKAK